MWASSLWVLKHCPFPAIISFTAVGMLKNYGWLRRRGTKIIVTFKSLAESQIRCCLQRFSISAAAMRERFRNGWIYFWSVLNSKFLFWNAEPLLACWGPACPFSLSQPWPGLSYSFLSAVINRDHLVYFSFFFSFSYSPSTSSAWGTWDSRDGSKEAGVYRGVRLLFPGDVYLPGSNPIAATTLLGSF